MALNTLGTLRAALRSFLRQPVPSSKGFTEQELNFWINTVQFDLARKLLRINQEEFYGIQTILCQHGYQDYTLDSTVGEIIAVTYEDRTVEKISPKDIGLLSTNANFEPSAYQRYWMRFEDTLRTYPASDCTSGDTLFIKVYHVKKPSEMTLDSHTTIIPIDYLTILILGAAAPIAHAVPHLRDKNVTKMYEDAIVALADDYVRDKSITIKLPGDVRR
jgi:hypothetical protein